MNKISPTEVSETEKSKAKHEKATTRVMMWLSVIDLLLTGLPYFLGLFSVISASNSNQPSTQTSPVTFIAALICVLKPVANFLVFWYLVPSFRKTFREIFMFKFEQN